MKYDFDTVIDRRHTSSVKWGCGLQVKEWKFTERFDDETIALFTADMDFRCPQPVIEALKEVVKHGIFGYSGTAGLPEYNQAICRWFRDRHDWKIAPESIISCNTATEALDIAIRTYSEEGDGILITRPVYGPFTDAILKNRRRVVNSRLIDNDGYYTMDFTDIERKIKEENVRIFALCSPHNPAGRVWSEGELKSLAEICERNGVIILSDEVHCEFTRKGVDFVTMAKVGKPENTVVVTGINKSFNCAGLCAAQVMIADERLRAGFKKEQGMSLPNPFAIAAVIAGYTEGDEWMDQVNAYIEDTIDWILEYVKKYLPKVRIRRPEGTYILWADFRGTGLSPEEIHDRIYNRANVCLDSGIGYDPEQGSGFERICIPSPRAIIKEAFERIAKEFADCME